ncbi:MAG TPA: DUF6152 family protein [Gammaproteobacteria bacterium]
MRTIATTIVLSVAALPLVGQAHHSVALNFSQDVITLNGTITELRWINPHASFVLAVENDDGSTEEWVVEMLALIALQRQGFDFDALQEGMEIQLTGRVGYRDHTLRFGEAITPNGTRVLERSPLSQRFRRTDADNDAD